MRYFNKRRRFYIKKRKTLVFFAIALLALISMFTIYSANRKSIKALAGSSQNWEVHIYMQKMQTAVLTSVTVLPLKDDKNLPKNLSAIIKCSDTNEGVVFQSIPLAPGQTYQSQFYADNTLYQHSDKLQFVISQEGRDETITLSKDKNY